MPEDWLQAEKTPERFKKGTFSLGGHLPEVKDNVILVKGLFADSLPPFLAAHEQHVGETSIRGTFASRAYSTAAVPSAISGSPLMLNKVSYALNIDDKARFELLQVLLQHLIRSSGVVTPLASSQSAQYVCAFQSSFPSMKMVLFILLNVAGNATISYLHIDCDIYSGARDALTLLTPKIRAGTVIVFDDLVNYQHFRDGEMLALWEWLQVPCSIMAVHPLSLLESIQSSLLPVPNDLAPRNSLTCAPGSPSNPNQTSGVCCRIPFFPADAASHGQTL